MAQKFLPCMWDLPGPGIKPVSSALVRDWIESLSSSRRPANEVNSVKSAINSR